MASCYKGVLEREAKYCRQDIVAAFCIGLGNLKLERVKPETMFLMVTKGCEDRFKR